MDSSGAKAASSPKTDNKEETGTKSLPSPKGGAGQCLCSPTTHEGSFRCRFHRSLSSTWMRRSKSMPSSAKSTTNPVISKPLETA